MNDIFTEIETGFMREALAEADRAAAEGEVPAGAVLVSPTGQLAARGRNRVITLNDPTAHAEILALREAAAALGNYRLTGFILYSTLEPCPMCMTAAIHSRLDAVYYGAPEPRWGAAASLMNLPDWPGLNHRLEVKGGLLADDCRAVITSFFRNRRRPAT